MCSNKQIKRAAAHQLKRNSKSVKLSNSVQGAITAHHRDGVSNTTSSHILPALPKSPNVPPLAPLPVTALSEADIESGDEQPNTEKNTQVFTR